MDKTVEQYQNAFNMIIKRLRESEDILAVLVFGSMITGDLWEESDIDLFVVLEEDINKVKNIYTEENNIKIHIKLLGKREFMKINDEDLKGGYIYRIFASSRIVFSKDTEITNIYDSGRYYPDIDRERWNMVYLGKLIKTIDICKKNLKNESIYNSYATAFKCAEEYSKLYTNFSGYLVSKDAVKTSSNLDDDFKNCLDNLIYNKVSTNQGIQNLIDFIETMINKNLKNITYILIQYLQNKNELLSSEEIKEDKLFEGFDINFEEILNKLYESKLISKECRSFKDKKGNNLFKENVYFL